MGRRRHRGDGQAQHPTGPWPLSGIRGYAVSVDNGSGSTPCGGPSECSPAETDLPGGAGDDKISLGLLPEGVNVVRAVAVSGSGLRSPEVTSAVIRVDATDPDVSLSAPHEWVDGPARVIATATDALSGMTANGRGPSTAIAVDDGVPRLDPGPSTALTVTGEGAHRVAFYGRDAAGNVGDEWPRSAVVGIDERRPGSPSPAPRTPPIQSGWKPSSATRSAPAPARGSIALRPVGTKQQFMPLPTAVSRGRLVARWDSDAFALRTYEFRATGYDAAGNAASSDRRDDGARMVLANPVKTPTPVAAGFGGASLVWPRCSRHHGQRRCRHQAITPFERGRRRERCPRPQRLLQRRGSAALAAAALALAAARLGGCQSK